MKPISGTSDMVRLVNRERLRDALRTGEGQRLAELARATGLSVATCANLIPELVGSGEAVVLSAQASGGRPARRYAYNPDYALAAAVILRPAGGAAEVRYSVRNGAGDEREGGVKRFAAFRAENLDDLLARLVRRHPAVKALALSIPGLVRNGEIEQCDIPQLAGINLEKRAADRFGLKAISENDMNFAAVGFHNAHSRDIGSGLAYALFEPGVCPGLGLVVNGALIKGKSGFAGEIANILQPNAESAPPRKRRRDDATALRIASVIVAVAAVVNPDVFVLSGALVKPGMIDRIVPLCLERIPERHLPELVVRPEYEEDSFLGMTALALAGLSCEVALVEKERLWC